MQERINFLQRKTANDVYEKQIKLRTLINITTRIIEEKN